MRVFALAVLLAQLPYAAHSVVVVYKTGIVASAPFSITPERLHALQTLAAHGELRDADLPQYTNEQRTNRALLAIGVERVERLFNAPQLGPTYRLWIAGATVNDAVAKLRSLPTVAYASPNWYVSPMSH
jgi:hypothetical protein